MYSKLSKMKSGNGLYEIVQDIEIFRLKLREKRGERKETAPVECLESCRRKISRSKPKPLTHTLPSFALSPPPPSLSVFPPPSTACLQNRSQIVHRQNLLWYHEQQRFPRFNFSPFSKTLMDYDSL